MFSTFIFYVIICNYASSTDGFILAQKNPNTKLEDLENTKFSEQDLNSNLELYGRDVDNSLAREADPSILAEYPALAHQNGHDEPTFLLNSKSSELEMENEKSLSPRHAHHHDDHHLFIHPINPYSFMRFSYNHGSNVLDRNQNNILDHCPSHHPEDNFWHHHEHEHDHGDHKYSIDLNDMQSPTDYSITFQTDDNSDNDNDHHYDHHYLHGSVPRENSREELQRSKYPYASNKIPVQRYNQRYQHALKQKKNHFTGKKRRLHKPL